MEINNNVFTIFVKDKEMVYSIGLFEAEYKSIITLLILILIM